MKHFLLSLALLWCIGLAGVAHAVVQPGSVIWTFNAGGPIWSSLTYDSGTLYFGSDDHDLYALDTGSQRLKWKFKTAGNIRARPATAGNLVYAASDDGFLYAVDRASGRERWRFDLKAKDLGRRPPSPDNAYYDYLQSSPLVHDGKVFIGSLSGTLFVVDAATGKSAWSVGTLDAIRSSPVVADGRLYFGSWDDHLYAVDLKTHAILWRADTGGIVQSTPALGEGRVVVGSRSAKLLAFDTKTGAEAWRHEYPDGSWVESSAIYGGGRFYVGSSDALKISAFDAASGQEIWQFKTGGWTWATPTLANGTLYVGALSASPYYFQGVTLRPGFYALDAATGGERWHFTPGATKGYVTGGLIGSPAVVNGMVYVGALDGRIYALKE